MPLPAALTVSNEISTQQSGRGSGAGPSDQRDASKPATVLCCLPDPTSSGLEWDRLSVATRDPIHLTPAHVRESRRPRGTRKAL